MVRDVEISFADPHAGFCIVVERHELPFVALVAHENNVADILVVLELESEAEHFLGVNADNGAGALVEYVRDIVVVHLTAVRLACFVGRVELCDINGLVCLDDLDRAGNVCEFNYIALCTSAFCVNLKFIFVDCGLAVGYDIELV